MLTRQLHFFPVPAPEKAKIFSAIISQTETMSFAYGIHFSNRSFRFWLRPPLSLFRRWNQFQRNQLHFTLPRRRETRQSCADEPSAVVTALTWGPFVTQFQHPRTKLLTAECRSRSHFLCVWRWDWWLSSLLAPCLPLCLISYLSLSPCRCCSCNQTLLYSRVSSAAPFFSVRPQMNYTIYANETKVVHSS